MTAYNCFLFDWISGCTIGLEFPTYDDEFDALEDMTVKWGCVFSLGIVRVEYRRMVECSE